MPRSARSVSSHRTNRTSRSRATTISTKSTDVAVPKTMKLMVWLAGGRPSNNSCLRRAEITEEFDDGRPGRDPYRETRTQWYFVASPWGGDYYEYEVEDDESTYTRKSSKSSGSRSSSGGRRSSRNGGPPRGPPGGADPWSRPRPGPAGPGGPGGPGVPHRPAEDEAFDDDDSSEFSGEESDMDYGGPMPPADWPHAHAPARHVPSPPRPPAYGLWPAAPGAAGGWSPRVLQAQLSEQQPFGRRLPFLVFVSFVPGVSKLGGQGKAHIYCISSPSNGEVKSGKQNDAEDAQKLCLAHMCVTFFWGLYFLAMSLLGFWLWLYNNHSLRKRRWYG